MTDYLGMEDQMAADHANAKYAEREIRRQVGHRLTEQQRAWLLKMPSWTAVRGEDILHHLDSLLNDLAATRAENQQLRDALERFYAEVDKAQRIDNTGGDSAVSVTLNSWDEYLHDDRPALAGTPSEDTPDPDTSPFDEPSYETVERGFDWIDRRVHGDDATPSKDT